MAIVREVLIGLLTTFIGFVIGFTWRMSRRQVTYWRARRFWRPFVSGDLKIVLARFREFDSWEPSGLVGVGGMQAAAELVAFSTIWDSEDWAALLISFTTSNLQASYMVLISCVLAVQMPMKLQAV